ncbi:hypothetical protein TcYC6_0073900 [Trypanosoma cruzi]|uniref:RING-type E3 ubiquitin transferase n=1 Tax=Trypanosoma cruzi TaxID=5693 RepID=A0A7J6XY89_TRYCR|nr:hypothetical protein ECC02_007526 [Trypanosoma cruzi]KAF8298477.1 hypothetical protein TcYC6_0073900 [Trypanosoma cruzi]
MSCQMPLCDGEVFAAPLGRFSEGETLLPKGEHASDMALVSLRVHEKELVMDATSRADNSMEKSCAGSVLKPVKPLDSKPLALGMMEHLASSTSSEKTIPRLMDSKLASSSGGRDGIVNGECCYSTPAGSLTSFGKVCKEKTVVAATEKSEEEEICCICLEEYTEENPMLYGECKHHFHLPCLMNWKQRSNVCPMCASETLRGLAEDEAPPPVRATDDDIFAILLQHQLGRYTRQGRQHRQRERELERERSQGNESAAQKSEQHLKRHTNLSSQCRSGRDKAPDERQRHLNGRGENSALANPSSKKATRGECESRVRDARENGMIAFFNRVFCCFKK